MRLTGRCVFAMKVTDKITFNEYWSSPAFLDKKPVRNGSRKMLVGDNIYWFDISTGFWRQADSHHSNADGTPNEFNLKRDTKSDKVLISTSFFYFGKAAPIVPPALFQTINFKNGRNYRRYDEHACLGLLEWLIIEHRSMLNKVFADPFFFEMSEKRYSARNNKIS